MNLDDPARVIADLQRAIDALSDAHLHAAEEDGLSGAVRDMIYGLNSAVEALQTFVVES